jgi:hypothetical protein
MDTDEVKAPPIGEAVTVGKVVSIIYSCVVTLPVFPAVSLAKYFKVVVEAIVIGEL